MPPASAVASAVEKLHAAAQDAANSSSRSATAFSEQAHQVLVPRAAGRVVSLSTCTKISAVSFAVGVVVGFTLKKRLRRAVERLIVLCNSFFWWSTRLAMLRVSEARFIVLAQFLPGARKGAAILFLSSIVGNRVLEDSISNPRN
ncbi:hypothetical protein GUJ93_ZPchr0008g13411 [Zizania palustris]|uniref:Uncharacterized protein n=1 Tax=Zizania palustris TaxID=103762 RepID=A0A8J5UWB3_ZIZPA|nr:hypothetical protein GUJ93_ZPchr0008g13411 [Zizania palustris]